MKRKRRSIRHDQGVVDDLTDQSEWSSYGAHVPRSGDPRRQGIWRNRIHRSWARFPFVGYALGLLAFLALMVLLAFVFSLFAD